MITKTPGEIERLAEGGAKLAAIMRELVLACKAGLSAAELDRLAEVKIRAIGGEPSFKGFGAPDKEFPNALCVSPNEMVVHGIPHEHLIFKEGDLVGLDLGMKYKGLYTDHAVTVAVGNVSEVEKKLLKITQECLDLGIKAAQAGNRIGDIGSAIQEHAEEAGFGVVRMLVGHGVGHEVHEEPRVPNFGKPGKGDKLVEGMVLAIEPMINIGGHEIMTADDGWGVVSADKSRTAHFEHTIAITRDGPRILTI